MQWYSNAYKNVASIQFLAGGVADKAGLKSNDYILEINGLSVRWDMELESW